MTSMDDKQKKKLRVAVLFGGRSSEHEISLQSAASVLRNLDPKRFEVVPIAVDKEGKWHLQDLRQMKLPGKSLPVFENAPELSLSCYPAQPVQASFDVVFPVLHGPLGEDGTVQGFLELAEIPYVGSGVLASAVGMDKEMAKRLARDAGLPVVPFFTIRKSQWENQKNFIKKEISEKIKYPLFVKPSNMGSSVGVHKVKNENELSKALEDAFLYDHKVLAEQAISAREIEVAVLENPVYGEPPLVSIPGEVKPKHEFYSYEAKYLDENGAELCIPAKLSSEQTQDVQKIAQDVFQALDCEGMGRVDLFLDKNSGQFYFNEINTIPGFTSISMYPKLFEASGISYQELLSRLVDLSLASFARKRKLVREYLPGK